MANPENRFQTELEKCVQVLKRIQMLAPPVGIVLGSGFQPLIDELNGPRIPFNQLPGFRLPSVPGHKPFLLFTTIESVPVAILCGRIHYYEGFSMDEITFPIRALAQFGVKILVLTNAAGGINPTFNPGDLMVIKDHINLMGVNPLRGSAFVNDTNRFLDLTETYDPTLREVMIEASRTINIRIHEGVYLAVSGPTYETPAEIEAFARLGADAVGMSTVPEAIVARHCGVRVIGISCITNMAAGRSTTTLSHSEVIEIGRKTASSTSRLLKAFLRLLKEKNFV